MSIPALAAVLTLASFAILWIMASTVRLYTPSSSVSATAEAKHLFARAVVPTIAPFVIAAGVLLPSFLLHETPRRDEWPGIVLLTLAAVGVIRILLVLARGLRTLMAARSLVSTWRRGAVPLTGGLWGAAASQIDAGFPVVAVAGIFRPHVFIDRCVLDVCSPGELAAVAAHERAHITSRDNLRRLLVLACVGPMSGAAASWRAASERAADERAVDSSRTAVDLAAALVRLARQAPVSTMPITALSTIHDGGCLETRIRRLLVLTGGTPRHRQPSIAVRITACIAAAAVIAVVPVTQALHSALELFVLTLP